MDVFGWPAGLEWRPVSSKLVVSRRIGLLPTGIALLVGAAVLWFVWSPGWAVALIAAGIAGLAWSWFAIGRVVRSWGYAERADDLLVRHGLLIRRLSVVPYGRMQFVDVTAGPIDRALGIATVRLHTAAASSDATIPGLLPDEAARLRDRLASHGSARTAGL